MRVFIGARFIFLAMAITFAMAAPTPAPAQNKAAAPSDTAEKLVTRHWVIDGVKRDALVHIPPDAQANPTPVVFAFHGYGGSMKQAADLFAIHKHWPQAIVVYMNGLPTANGDDPNAKVTGWEYYGGKNGDRDVKFFDTVLADMRQNFKVDDKRVYVVGFSNGGWFAFVLWSKRGDQIAAVVSCAMHAFKELIATFTPKPLLQIAGREDKLQLVSVQEKTVLAVAKLNECEEGRPWGEKQGCTIYPSKIGAPVVFFIHSGGHEVPKEAPARIVEFLKKETQQPGRKPQE